MLLWTGWGINKLSECSKNVYLYEKMEGKAENMGDFIEKRYKSKDEIKRNKRLFLRREHYDNAQMLSTIKRTLWKKILANK